MITSTLSVPLPSSPAEFDGDDYVSERDRPRLSTQLEAIRAFMQGKGPLTLETISKATGAPHASVSAQIRNLRKPQFGAHTVVRRHLGAGLYSYELVA